MAFSIAKFAVQITRGVCSTILSQGLLLAVRHFGSHPEEWVAGIIIAATPLSLAPARQCPGASQTLQHRSSLISEEITFIDTDLAQRGSMLVPVCRLHEEAPEPIRARIQMIVVYDAVSACTRHRESGYRLAL